MIRAVQVSFVAVGLWVVWMLLPIHDSGTAAAASAPSSGAATNLMPSLRKVLPTFDNNPETDVRAVKDKERDYTFYIARRGTNTVGAAFVSRSVHGYAGPIDVVVGVLPNGTINAIDVLKCRETPSLGTRVAEPKFKDQFKGRSASDTVWAKVRKDGGEIQAVTGATISSRAVTEAVKAGLDAFAKHREELP